MIPNYPKWDPITTPNYWQYRAEKSGFYPDPDLIYYMNWRETPEHLRQPRTQAEFSKKFRIPEETLKIWFREMFQRAIDESLWETEEIPSPYF